MFNQLKNEVSLTGSVLASAMILLAGLAEKLEAELENTRSTGDLAGVSDTVRALKEQSHGLANAVVSGTIAEPAPTPTPEALGSGDSTNTGSEAGSDAGEVAGADATDNADGSGAEVDAGTGTDTATEVAVEETVTGG